MACNTRRKGPASGEWIDRPNYFDVTVWGAQGENCETYLAKGRPVAIDGRQAAEGGGRTTPQSEVPDRRRRL